jgi:hypothetical protein
MGFNFRGGIIVHLPNYKRWGWFANQKQKAIKLYALSSKKDLKCQGNLTKDVNN